MQLTVVNDPIPLVTFKGSGVTDLVGTAANQGHLAAGDGRHQPVRRAPAIDIGPSLVQKIASYVPSAAVHARQLEGQAKLRADLGYHPSPLPLSPSVGERGRGEGMSQPWSYEVHGELHHGKLTHARLPMPLNQLEVSFRYADGKFTEGSVHAQAGTADLGLAVKDLVLNPEASFEDQAKDLDLEVKHLAVTEGLFASLPQNLQEIQHDFKPGGLVTLGYHLRHEAHGQWNKHAIVLPEDLSICFIHFPYVLEHITGKIEQVTTSARGCDEDQARGPGRHPAGVHHRRNPRRKAERQRGDRYRGQGHRASTPGWRRPCRPRSTASWSTRSSRSVGATSGSISAGRPAPPGSAIVSSSIFTRSASATRSSPTRSST